MAEEADDQDARSREREARLGRPWVPRHNPKKDKKEAAVRMLAECTGMNQRGKSIQCLIVAILNLII